MALNPALVALAQRRVWQDAGGPPMEKVAVVPPEAAAGGMPPGGAPPMDPAMAGGMPPPGAAPPMDPAMGGMPPGGAPPMPMDPAMAGAPGAGAMPGAAPGMDPAAAGQKMKPEQMMQMLDFRLYNMQQQMTALMNAMDVSLPPGALVTPPGSPTPVAEAAVPGGPQDPGVQEPSGGGGGSAISPIEAIQGASPELAGMGGGGGGMGGGEKMGSDASLSELIEKMAEGTAQGTVDEEGPRHSSPPQKLPGGHPGKRPGTQAITAGGSKDPLSRTEASDGMGAVNKTAAAIFAQDLAGRDPSRVGTPFDVMQDQKPADNAAAVAAMLRRRVAGAA